MASYTSVNPVVGRQLAVGMLGALTSAPAEPLTASSKIRLSQDSGFNPSPGDDPATYVAGEADFSGYTAGGYSPTFTGVLQTNGNQVARGANVIPVVASADPQVGNTIYGYWWEDADGLIVAERFPVGVSFEMASPGDFLDLMALIPVELRPTV